MATHEETGQSSSIGFPAFESPSKVSSPSQMRPFRRISMPSFPSGVNRNSIASMSSTDSLTENNEARPGMVVLASSPGNIRFPRTSITTNISRTRPNSSELPKRRSRKRSSSAKPATDTKSQQRKQVVEEIRTTEKSYLDGLELIYSHFLSPIVAALETSKPLLDRASITSVFSNFIDIWNLHRSFYSALAEHLGDNPTSIPPPLSPVLLSHFPYLSLYTPFITSFPSMISTLTDMITPPNQHRPNPRYDQDFATFISTQEADPICGKLKLRDWLLTIVQRCPRYLLLLKDLIKYTDEDDPEYVKLNTVIALVNKITASLNTSLQTHAQILSLLALQRSTSGLPIQLIEPGRIFLKRATLIQVERSSAPREREFLLFSDCLLWLANEEVERAWNLGWSTGTTSDSSSPQTPVRPKLVRSRSKSEAELLKSKGDSEGVSDSPQRPHSTVVPPPMKKPSIPPPPAPRRLPSTGEERWIYKGQVSLVDIEVIVVPSREEGDERRLEVLSPGSSFVLYAGSEDERDNWVSEIRQAKAQLLASLNMINPNSTLTSSSSTNHLRRSLQALPFPPSDERIATIRAVQSSKDFSELNAARHDEEKKGKEKEPVERRRKVEHWVPAIWIPDERTDSCSVDDTFFIADPKETSSKPARACEACYETVFPLVDPPTNGENPSVLSSSSFLSSNVGTVRPGKDTITSLSMLPSWVSMPSLPTQSSQPQALMQMATVDISTDLPVPHAGTNNINATTEVEAGKRGRVRLKSANSRPKSFHQILEDFQQGQPVGGSGGNRQLGIFPSSPSTLIDSAIEENSESSASEDHDGDGFNGSAAGEADDFEDHAQLPLPTPPSINSLSQPPSPSPRRREDTARRSKRFSLPAVALHTTNVTARTTSMTGRYSGSGSGGNGSTRSGSGGASGVSGKNGTGGAMGRLRRLSLVSNSRN
ncbi:hypothetical protein NP233_g1000 [Leucocoprinus birnbaumii]|uniref:DH domain-containing protein n=1 Tax=Leucocoprinus birnbaumii TaxID=56174 RepID=A0AAD5W1C7_9AGAR|nr:hypothetical protein NP233_g1000 [Leucocoprinus birnbaumii]